MKKSISALVVSIGMLATELIQSAPIVAYEFSNLAGGSNGYGNNNYTLGFKFTALEDLNVTELGVYDYLGNGPGTDRTAAIYQVVGNSYTQITSANFGANQAATHLLGGYSYRDIADVTLSSGQTYAIVSSGYYGGDNAPLAYRNQTTLNGIDYLTSGYNVRYDLNTDPTVPLYNYDLSSNYYTYLSANFIYDNDIQPSTSSVPEPTSVALFGVGLLILAAYFRKIKIAI